MTRYAYDDAAQLCDAQYLSHPGLHIRSLDTTTQSTTVKCVYVPSHLHHIFFEIFKVGGCVFCVELQTIHRRRPLLESKLTNSPFSYDGVFSVIVKTDDG